MCATNQVVRSAKTNKALDFDQFIKSAVICLYSVMSPSAALKFSSVSRKNWCHWQTVLTIVDNLRRGESLNQAVSAEWTIRDRLKRIKSSEAAAAGGKLVNLDDDFTKVEVEDGAEETDGMPTLQSQAYQIELLDTYENGRAT